MYWQARASYNKTVTTPSMHEDGNSGGNKGVRACVYLQPCVFKVLCLRYCV